MEVLDIGLDRTAILPPTIVMTMVFIMMNILECLQVMEDVDVGLLIPPTLALAILEFIIMVIGVVNIVEVDIGLKIPDTIPIVIVDQDLIFMGEVDIGLRTDTLPSITQVVVADCWVSHFLLVF